MSKRVLVTGSSRGIGRAIALELAAKGWTVAIHGSQVGSELQKTRELLGDRCGGVYAADMAHPKAAEGLIAQVLEVGPLQALVNNAGVYHPLKFLEASDSEFEANLSRSFAVNFETPLRLTRCIAKHFESQGSGKILNVASRVVSKRSVLKKGGDDGLLHDSILHQVSVAASTTIGAAKDAPTGPVRNQTFRSTLS